MRPWRSTKLRIARCRRPRRVSYARRRDCDALSSTRDRRTRRDDASSSRRERRSISARVAPRIRRQRAPFHVTPASATSPAASTRAPCERPLPSMRHTASSLSHAVRAEIGRGEPLVAGCEHGLGRNAEFAAAAPLHASRTRCDRHPSRTARRLEILDVVPHGVRARADDVDRIAERRQADGQQRDSQLVAFAGRDRLQLRQLPRLDESSAMRLVLGVAAELRQLRRRRWRRAAERPAARARQARTQCATDAHAARLHEIRPDVGELGLAA